MGLHWTSSSQVELRPMTDSPPTVSSVYVTLKSVVSYHANGSRRVPLALSGMSALEMVSSSRLEGFSMSAAAPMTSEEEDEELLLLLVTMPTGMAMARMTTRTATRRPM